MRTRLARPAAPPRSCACEHEQIRGFLGAIAGKFAAGQNDTGDDESGLLAVLGPHNHKEENILYPMIDRIVGEEERTELFAAMDKQK